MRRIYASNIRYAFVFLLLFVYFLFAYLMTLDERYDLAKARITFVSVDWGNQGRSSTKRILVYYQFFAGENRYQGSDDISLGRPLNREQTEQAVAAWVKNHPIGNSIEIEYLRILPSRNHIPKAQLTRFSELITPIIFLWLLSCFAAQLCFAAYKAIKALRLR